MTVVARWFRERVPLSGDQLRELTNEPVPNHLKRWWFCLGGTPAYLFVVQIVTGILLAIYYQPSPTTAYESVEHITDDVTFGWYFRSLHKWAATLMIAAVILHQMRVYFTGAYRKPRELNWMIGMCLLLCTLGLGFTGYSLVFEQLSYWGATVGGNILSTVPLVGEPLKKMLLAGDVYNEQTLPRFFILHAAILPVTMVLLILVHILLIRLHGVTELQFEDEPPGPEHFNFFPDHFYTELIMGLMLMIVLSALATILPAAMGPKADPLVTPEVIKPEWFFYVTFRWLKLFGPTFAVLSMGFIVFAMFVWPWIDSWLRKVTRQGGGQRLDRHRRRAGDHRSDRLGSRGRALSEFPSHGHQSCRHAFDRIHHDAENQTALHRRPRGDFPGLLAARAVDGSRAQAARGRHSPPRGSRAGQLQELRRVPPENLARASSTTGRAARMRPRASAASNATRPKRRMSMPSTTTARRSPRSSRRATAAAATSRKPRSSPPAIMPRPATSWPRSTIVWPRRSKARACRSIRIRRRRE